MNWVRLCNIDRSWGFYMLLIQYNFLLISLTQFPLDANNVGDSSKGAHGTPKGKPPSRRSVLSVGKSPPAYYGLNATISEIFNATGGVDWK